MHDATLPDDLSPMSERHTIDLDPKDIALQPTRSRWDRVIDRTPFFLLSGVIMLGGCFLVSQHIHDLVLRRAEHFGLIDSSGRKPGAAINELG